MKEVSVNGKQVNGGIKEFLEAMVLMRQNSNLAKPKHWKYASTEEFVLEYGKYYKFKTLPEDIEIREPKACFSNAFELMIDRMKELVYVEGYATVKEIALPVLHGWCINKKKEVVDPTWENGNLYFGVAFKSRFAIEEMLKTEKYGLLDSWEEGWPLLRNGVNRDTDIYRK